MTVVFAAGITNTILCLQIDFWRQLRRGFLRMRMMVPFPPCTMLLVRAPQPIFFEIVEDFVRGLIR